METPPTYAPPKKSNTGLIIGLVLGGIAICCIGGVALMFFGGLAIFKGVAPMAECAMNYTFVQKALDSYEREHDGKLPSAAKWQEELAPYVAKETANQKEGNPFKIMDANGDWGCTAGDTKTGMAFNVELDGRKMEDARAKNAIVIFETPKTGRNLALKYEVLDRTSSPKIIGGTPRGWITIEGARGLMMDNKPMGGKFDMN